MNYMQILKRSWKILWAYPALWVFGIIMALTAGASSSNGSSSGSNYKFNGSNPTTPSVTPSGQWGQVTDYFNRIGDQLTQYFNNPGNLRAIIGVVIGLVCLGLLVSILFTFAKYVSQVALIRMVDGYETSGEKVTWKQGFRLGWSKSAWRLFLIDLVIGLPLAVAFIVLFGCAAIPVVLGFISGGTPTLINIIPTIGMVFLVIFIIVVVSVLLALVLEIIHRVCILQDKGVFDAIRQGWQMVRQNLKSVFLMWLILVGIGIVYGLATIPVALILVVLGLVVGGLVGGLLYLAVHTAATVTAGVITAVIVGVLLFILVLALPLLFLGGLKETYFSTTWTLVYREIKPVLPEAPALPLEGDAIPLA
jgi:hypothetical protein